MHSCSEQRSVSDTWGVGKITWDMKDPPIKGGGGWWEAEAQLTGVGTAFPSAMEVQTKSIPNIAFLWGPSPAPRSRHLKLPLKTSLVLLHYKELWNAAQMVWQCSRGLWPGAGQRSSSAGAGSLGGLVCWASLCSATKPCLLGRAMGHTATWWPKQNSHPLLWGPHPLCEPEHSLSPNRLQTQNTWKVSWLNFLKIYFISGEKGRKAISFWLQE